VGLACSSYLSGAGLPINWNDLPHTGVQLKLDRSGGVTVFCGATEIGQGSDDVLVAIVSEVLGVAPADVRAITGDTDLTPVDLGSYSSRVTLMMGNAAIQAAERARELIADAVARRLTSRRHGHVCRGPRVAETPTGMTFRRPSARPKRCSAHRHHRPTRRRSRGGSGRRRRGALADLLHGRGEVNVSRPGDGRSANKV
jgi:CO/xanthine dehydrogenase Mo-binding subunit